MDSYLCTFTTVGKYFELRSTFNTKHVYGLVETRDGTGSVTLTRDPTRLDPDASDPD